MGRMIGTLRESSLHADLKRQVAQPGDLVEVPLDGYVVDLLRGDLVIEIQTHNFSAIKRKLARLLDRHPVRLIYPIALEKWIVRVETAGGEPLGRRKSPRRGCWEYLFLEMVSLAELAAHPGFAMEVLLIREEEIRCREPIHRRRRWRPREWRTCERRLLDVVDRRVLRTPADYAGFLPPQLPRPFTSRELADALDQPLYLAQKMAYCLRKMGALDLAGQRRRAHLYMARSARFSESA